MSGIARRSFDRTRLVIQRAPEQARQQMRLAWAALERGELPVRAHACWVGGVLLAGVALAGFILLSMTAVFSSVVAAWGSPGALIAGGWMIRLTLMAAVAGFVTAVARAQRLEAVMAAAAGQQAMELTESMLLLQRRARATGETFMLNESVSRAHRSLQRDGRRLWTVGFDAAASTRFPHAVAALVAAIVVLGTHGTASMLWRIAFLGAGSATTGVSMDLVGSVQIEIAPPAYTGLGAQTVAGSDGNLTVLPGSDVTFSPDLRREIDQLYVEIEDGGEVACGGDDDEWKCRIQPRDARRYRFSATISGLRIIDTRQRVLSMDDDLPPIVGLSSDVDTIDVELGKPVFLKGQAEDDYGLDRMAWLITDPTGFQLTVPYEGVALDGGRVFAGPVTLETILLYDAADRPDTFLRLVAFDRDDINGPKAGGSAAIEIVIHSQEAQHRLWIEDLSGLQRQLVGVLGDGMEAADPPNSYSQMLGRLRAGTQEGRQTIQRLRSDPAFENATETSKQRLTWLDSELAKIGSARASTDTIVPLENVVWAIDKLIQRENVSLLDRRQERIADATDALTRAMESSDDLSDKEIRSLLDRLQQEMEAFARERDLRTKTLPQEYVNQEAARDSELDKNKSLVEQVRELLKQGKNEDARQMLQKLLEQMEKMQDEYRKDTQSSGARENPTEMDELQKQARKLDDLMKRTQRQQAQGRQQHEKAQGDMEKVRQSTTELSRSLQDETVSEWQQGKQSPNPAQLKERLEERAQQGTGKEREGARQMQSQLGKSGAEKQWQQSQKTHEQVSDKIDEMEKLTEEMNGKTLGAFGEVRERLREARELTEQQLLDNYPGSPMDEAQRTMEQIGEKLQQAADAFQRLKDQAAEQLGGNQQQGMMQGQSGMPGGQGDSDKDVNREPVNVPDKTAERRKLREQVAGELQKGLPQEQQDSNRNYLFELIR